MQIKKNAIFRLLYMSDVPCQKLKKKENMCTRRSVKTYCGLKLEVGSTQIFLTMINYSMNKNYGCILKILTVSVTCKYGSSN